ncbi:PH domain containing protein [Rhodotorula toruloides]|uniref:PH domain containing protein n=1 Tax=Rhodotorula toruloides TaxID=5286 RepID=A0A511KMW7_RHOTO|nr:PH domain containing protein [Rhodotorula toruloides]
MSSLLRLSSYGSSASAGQTSHGYPKSPATPSPQPPTEAYPPAPVGTAKPSDILINRMHEIKRIAKGLAGYFQGVSEAHHAHSLSLKKLSTPGTTPIATPLAESSIFIPLPASSTSSSSEPNSPGVSGSAPTLGGSGSEGWQQILHFTRETNSRVAEAHADLAKQVGKDVVGPLLKSRVEMKSFIQIMEREIVKAVEAVQKERDTAAPLLTRLSTSLTQSSLPLSAPALSPIDDPVLLRAQVEAQLRAQVIKENELLAVVKTWTEKVEQREKEVFAEIKRVWGVWEQANSAMLLGNQQLSMFLSATVDSVPPDAEWQHFLKLNHVVLPDVAEKTLDDVQWDGKGHELTSVVMEGMLERQTSFLKSWKPAYFVLTPSGHLHIYPPPPASAAPAAASDDETERASLSSTPSYAPLSASAQYLLLHTSPHLSLNLALCTLGPMPTPSKASTETEGKKKAAPLDAVFTLIESLGKNGKGEGTGTRHVVRCKGEKGWEEMGTWVAAIGKFCATPSVPPPPSPPTPTPASTFPPPGTIIEDEQPQPRDSISSLETHIPPTLPARSLPLGSSPALPSLPTSPQSTSSAAPPPLPPRDSYISTTSTTGSEDLSNVMRSSLIIEDDYDLSRAMNGLGVAVGENEGIGEALSSPPPPVPPRLESPSGSEDEGEEEDAGDLGRSISSSSLPTVGGRQAMSPRQGSVRSLAAAWEKNGQTSPPVQQERRNGSVSGSIKEVKEEEDTQDDGADGAGAKDEELNQDEENERAATPKGKKGKKKRKSKGGANAAKPTERPLPLPSVDPEHADLGLPTPHSPNFNPLPSDEHPADVEEAKSPPPMVLEEVEEAPSRGSLEEREQEDDMGVAQ